jgi:hypothetical protein
VPEDAFAADNVPGGGAPRPNPGADASNWEAWQQDELGQTRVTAGALPQDRMARRMAYTANRALMPRNRLVPSGSLRHDELVAPALVSNPSRTILLAEWWHTTAAGWQTVSIDARSRAHWPVNPFIGATSGTNPYNEGVTGTFARFGYPALSRVLPASGDGFEAIADSGTELSAVARQRPKNSSFFAMLDGSVQRMSVSRSITQRLWGDRFWSISGNDRVQP